MRFFKKTVFTNTDGFTTAVSVNSSCKADGG